jgi:2-phosphoglycerate kinase
VASPRAHDAPGVSPSAAQAPGPGITVLDRADNRLPFSRGIMATSLLATGVPTEEAYRLASIVQQHLLARGVRELDAEQLVTLTHDLLLTEAQDADIADRWTAWRRAKRSGRPIAIVLAGAPGTGKSTLATRLAVRLNIPRVVTTDAIRDVLRTVVPANVLPELHRSTFEVVEPDAVDPFGGFLRQCNAVGAAAVAVAHRLADEHRSIIIEGVHALPGATTRALCDHPASPIVIERLIVQEEPDRHADLLRRRATSEPQRRGDRHLAGLDRIRMIQQRLQHDAHVNDVHVVDGGEAGDLTQDIVDEIVQRLETTPSSSTTRPAM